MPDLQNVAVSPPAARASEIEPAPCGVSQKRESQPRIVAGAALQADTGLGGWILIQSAAVVATALAGYFASLFAGALPAS